MKDTIKKLIKALNNYKLTARLMAIAGLCAIVVNVMLFVFYQLSGGQQVGDSGVVEQITAFNDAKLVGMVYFLAAIISTILSIAIVYVSIPFSFPKDKMTPNKALPWMVVANGCLQFILAILVIYLLATEATLMLVGFVIALVLGVLVTIYSALFAFPATQCRFYMPSLLIEEKK